MPDGDSNTKKDPAGKKALGEEFLNSSLGPWSSHPSFAALRLRKARVLAFGVGLFLVAVVGWHLQRLWRGQWQPGDLVSFLPALLDRKLVTLGLVFAISASLTAALTIRASIISKYCARPSFAPAAWRDGLIYLALLFAVCAGLAWFGQPGFGLSVKWRVTLLMAGILPVHLLRWVLAVNSEPAESPGSTDEAGEGSGIVRSFGAVIASALSVAGSLMALGEFATPVSRVVMGFLQPLLANLANAGGPAFLQALMGQMAMVVARHAASAITVYLFQLAGAMIAVGITLRILSSIDAELCRNAEVIARGAQAKKTYRSRARTRPSKSLWRRIWEWILRRIFGRELPPEPAPFEGPTASWAEQLEERLNRRRDLETSSPDVRVRWIPGPLSEGVEAGKKMNNWRWVFGNRVPSKGQEDCFDRFRNAWFKAQKETYSAFASPNRHRFEIARLADLYIESVARRAGLTSLLQACAVYAVAARGQRVLILVGTEEEKKVQRQAIQKILADAEFHHLIEVGGLTDSEMLDQCGPRARTAYQKEQLPPEILIATPDEYDAAFLDSKWDDERVRALLLSIEVILVDGLDRMSADLRWRVHLPFLLDKHRLALSAEGRIAQVVIGGSTLSEDDPDKVPKDGILSVVRQRLALRLFGGDGSMAGRFIRLQRFANPPIDALEITISGTARPDEALRTLAVQIRAVVPDEKIGFPRAAKEQTPVPPGLTELIIEELLDPAQVLNTAYFEAKGIRWLVVPGDLPDEKRSDLYMALSRGKPEGLVLLVFVIANGNSTVNKARPVFPVFVSPEASALLISHLFSILPVLRVDAPIRREKFARFGLNWDPRRLKQHSRNGRMRASEDWEIEWDGDLKELLESAASDDPWPAVFIRRDISASWKGTGLRWPVDEGICLNFDDSERTIKKAVVEVARVNSRYATWVSPRGVVLHTSDLFLQDLFCLKIEMDTHATRCYFPIKIAPYRPQVSKQGSSDNSQNPERSISDQAPIIERAAAGVLIELQEDLEPSKAKPDRPDVVTWVQLTSQLVLDGPYRVASSSANWEELVFRWAPTEVTGPIQSQECLRGLVSSDGTERLAASSPIEYTVETGVTVVVLGGRFGMRSESIAGHSEADIQQLIRDRFLGDWKTGSWPAGSEGSDDAGPGNAFWPLLTECVQVAVAKCAPRLQDLCRIFAFHPRTDEGPVSSTDGEKPEDPESELAVLLVLENPTTVGTALEVIRTLLEDAGLREHLLDEMQARLSAVRSLKKASAFVGPKIFNEDFEESKKKVEKLLIRMRVSKALPRRDEGGTQPSKGSEGPPPVVPPAPPSAELPSPPFSGKYVCGNCSEQVQVDLKVGEFKTGNVHSKCGRCSKVLYYLADSVCHGPLYPMQFLGTTPWPGSAKCSYPPRSKDRLIDICRTLAGAMSYELDHKQHGPERTEVWHSSLESLHFKKGDCEDHSILLVDWLVSEGYEARVVVGDVTGDGFLGDGGHAWVAVRLQGVEYHIEATNKNSDPMAPVDNVDSVWPGRRYVAKFQFDHGGFWSLKETEGAAQTPSGWLGRLFSPKRAPVSFWNESAWEKGLFLRKFHDAVPEGVPESPAAPSSVEPNI